jgi:hypothetical protein
VILDALPAGLGIRVAPVHAEDVERALLLEDPRELTLGHRPQSVPERGPQVVEVGLAARIAAPGRALDLREGAGIRLEGIRLRLELVEETLEPLSRGREVGLVGKARHLEHLHLDLPGSREFLRMSLVVALDVGSADAGRVDLEAVRMEPHVFQLEGLVLEEEAVAHVSLGDLGSGDHVFLQLLRGELRGHRGFDLAPGKLGVRVLQLGQVLPVVELPVGHEDGGLHEEVGRSEADRGLDLLRGHLDAPAARLLVHELGPYDLLPGLLPDIAVLSFLERALGLELLDHLVVDPGELLEPDRVAVHLADDTGASPGAALVQHAP